MDNNYWNIFKSIDLPLNKDKKIIEKKIYNKFINILDNNLEKKYFCYKNSVVENLREIFKNHWFNKLEIKLNNKKKFIEFLVFGSRANDLDLEDDDIDLILIVPKNIDRKIDFFDKIDYYLKEYNNLNNEKVNIINKIENSNTPLLKLEFKNIDFDILFANISYQNYNKIKNNKNINNINKLKFDNINQKIFNAYKNVLFLNEILNKNNFLKKFIKIIKIWAKANGLYSFNFCFLNGFSIINLCIKIYYLYPNYSIYNLFERFFFIFSEFPFKEIPINISKYNTEMDENFKKLPIKILAPFDSNCILTYSFTSNTLKVLKEHMRFMRNFCYSNGSNFEKSIFRYPFFDSFDYFLEIQIKSENYLEYKKYKSFVEANIKNLIYFLENNFKNVNFRPWPTIYDIFTNGINNNIDENNNIEDEDLDSSFIDDLNSNMQDYFENNIAISKISNINYYKGYIFFGLKEIMELKQTYNFNQIIENWKIYLEDKNINMYYNGEIDCKIITKNDLKNEIIEIELQIIDKFYSKFKNN